MAVELNFGPSGPTPTPPDILRAELLAMVAAVRPGYTATLPGSLIEDISSTSVGALVNVDQLTIDLVNSFSPFGANSFILNELGQLFGVSVNGATSTSVLVVFTGTPGFVLGQGFIVSDGNFQYALQDGGVIGNDGQSDPLFAVGTQSGIWAVPAGTVTQTVTSVPSPYAVTVVNPQSGVPGSDGPTLEQYRSQVMEASQVIGQGYFSMLKTLLGNVPGVQGRLINAIPQPSGGWEILVGGGDPYLVAYAIYTATQDISTLRGSTINVSGITNANPGVVSTDITHNLTVGQAATISGAAPSPYNDTYAVLAVPTPTSFSLGKNFSARQITSLSWAATPDKATVGFAAAHGVTVGSTITLIDSVPVAYNGTFVVTDVPSGTTLKYALTPNPGASTILGQLEAGIANVNTTLTAPWTSGGIITPNSRNVSPTIIDYPNSYVIPFAVPPQQTVTMTVTWNTTSPNFVSDTAIAQVVAPAMAAYVNSIQQGQPLNEFDMDAVFRRAVSSILLPTLVSRIVYSISIDGIGKSVVAGTGLVNGDPQSFLFAQAAGINVVQG